MPAPNICRICLETKVKLFNYNSYELKKYYEQILNTKIKDNDGLPQYFCYMCATMLCKFHKFKEKCFNGQKILKELLWKGPITIKSVNSIDRHAEKLDTSLDIVNVKHVRSLVRTFVIKSKRVPKVHISVASVIIDTSVGDNDLLEDFKSVESSLELVEFDGKTENEVKPNYYDKSDNIDKKKTSDNLVLREISVSDDEKPSDKEIIKDEPERECDETKFDNDNIPSLDNIDNDAIRFSDDEQIHFHDISHSNEDDAIQKEPDIIYEKKEKHVKKKKKKKVLEIEKKKKRFEITDKKMPDLDPNNWLKFNLSEEEAVEEFNARALHKRYISAKHKCNDCLKGFSKEDMLVRHIKLRHSETVGPIECRFCHMRFKWKCFLRKHMRQHYTKYKCLRCDLVCPLETTALFHEEYHNGVIRKCAHCDQEFKHLTTYYTHLRTHRSEHVCTLCGASFVSAIGLGIHKKIKHVNAESTVPKIADGEGEYCNRCDIKFETRKAYEEHLLHSAMHVDGLEDLEVEVPIIANPRKRRRNHRRLTRIPTDCHICGKHFATQAACRKHHLAEHPRTSFFAPNERHICEICGISLAPGSISSHVNTHTREKLYSCSTCGKEFNSKGGMTTHQLTHTTEKPVACTLCDKRFKQSSSMRLHYRTFHLKEPYPKRNRKKKTDDIPTKLDEYPEEPHENMPLDRWHQ